MHEDKIDELRDELYSLIFQEADYNKVLEKSKELDECITEFTIKELNGTSSYKQEEKVNNSK